MAIKNVEYLAFWPDGIDAHKKSSLPDWDMGMDRDVQLEVKCLVIASPEVKTRFLASTLGNSASLATSDLIRSNDGEAKFLKYIPDELIGQLMHQFFALGLRLVLSVFAAETGVLYIVLIRPAPLFLTLLVLHWRKLARK